MASEDIALFLSIGLSEQKAQETLKNEAVTRNIKQVVEQVTLPNKFYQFFIKASKKYAINQTES